MTDPALDRAPGAHEPESPAAIAGRLRARAEYRRKVARSHDRAAAAEFYWPPKSREEHERARDHLLAEARDLEEAAGRLEHAARALDRAAGRLEELETIRATHDAYGLRQRARDLRAHALELEHRADQLEHRRPIPRGAQPALLAE